MKNVNFELSQFLNANYSQKFDATEKNEIESNIDFLNDNGVYEVELVRTPTNEKQSFIGFDDNYEKVQADFVYYPNGYVILFMLTEGEVNPSVIEVMNPHIYNNNEIECV